MALLRTLKCSNDNSDNKLTDVKMLRYFSCGLFQLALGERQRNFGKMA